MKSTSEQQSRNALRDEFLERAGWARADAQRLAGDASTRGYERLAMNGRTALLMNAPPGDETFGCAPEDDAPTRRRNGYNAMARLAGPNLNAFLDVASMLRNAGLSAPEIYHADADVGFALIEDLGDALYVRAIEQGADEKTLYSAAIDALVHLRMAAPDAPQSKPYTMQQYDRLAMAAEVDLLREWYQPWKAACADQARADQRRVREFSDAWTAAWDDVLKRLAEPSYIVLRDFHAENLLWLPDRVGHRRTGVIDFQDGLVGHAAYDLVSLLEDARRDVGPAIQASMLDRYCTQLTAALGGAFHEDGFRAEYAILGAQRNAKILGIFARLINRDGKPRYAQFIPRVEAHFAHNLSHPALKHVAKVFADAFGPSTIGSRA